MLHMLLCCCYAVMRWLQLSWHAVCLSCCVTSDAARIIGTSLLLNVDTQCHNVAYFTSHTGCLKAAHKALFLQKTKH